MEQKARIICSQCGFESELGIGDYCPICGKKFGEEDLVPEKKPEKVEPAAKNPESEPAGTVHEADHVKAAAYTAAIGTAEEISEGGRRTPGLWDANQPSENPKKKILGLAIVLILIFLVVCTVGSLGSNDKDTSSENAASSEETAQEAVVQSEPVQVEPAQNEAAQSETVQEEIIQEAAVEEKTELVYPTADVYPSAPSGKYVKLVFSTASTTSILKPESKEYHYEPSRAIDGDIITSWQEGADGNGEGEQLLVSFPGTEQVKYLCLYTGNWRDQERFYNNCRPASMSIYMGGYEFDIKLADGMKSWYVVFSEPVETDSILFEINSVYKGAVSPDLCISEIFAYGES